MKWTNFGNENNQLEMQRTNLVNQTTEKSLKIKQSIRNSNSNIYCTDKENQKSKEQEKDNNNYFFW